MAGPRGNRIHAAGMVGRNRRAWARVPDRAPVFVGGQVGEYLAGAYASAATLASRLRPDRRRCRRTDRPVDAGNANPVPDLLPGQLLRNAWPAMARCPAAHGAGCGPGQRRSGGPRMWDRAAVVRPVRDGRSPGVDRRGIAAVDHRAGQHPRRRDLCLGGSNPVDEIRELATAFRIPNAPVGNGANIASLDHFRERGSFVRNPRDGFQQPGHPYRMRPARLRPAAAGAAAG